MSEIKTPHRREIKGVVVSRSGDKSAKIRVERRVLHPRYHKIVKRFNNFIIHDENNELQVGDLVIAAETSPIAKSKNFRLKSYTRPEVVA
ncbi:MAG: 30S ribosomal protein S17 [Helicobacteraceae bacterium]|jgi:small subunit ribosomal protein S17|nr:30S ribosomal protein S17 [Helicobacteraceae bacterium]